MYALVMSGLKWHWRESALTRLTGVSGRAIDCVKLTLRNGIATMLYNCNQAHMPPP